MVKDIIPAVDKEALEAELSPDRLVRRYKGLEVYIVTAHNAPHVMDEIGRIREIEFRKEGGGTAQEKDVDHYDTGDIPYKQIVAWDGQEREIVAMYRYILCRDAVITPDDIKLATYRLFHFSDRFKRQVLPQTIELGRSVVNRSAKRALYVLYFIWCGLAALVCEYPDIGYFFGKTTLYDTYNVEARDTLLYFMELYYSNGSSSQASPLSGPLLRRARDGKGPGGAGRSAEAAGGNDGSRAEGRGAVNDPGVAETPLVTPREDLRYKPSTDRSKLRRLFGGKNYKKDYAALLAKLASVGESMPPIINSYLKLTSTIKCFGTAWNPYFGNVMETALLLTIRDIRRIYRRKFIDTYKSINPTVFA